ncbi:hypothetical protein CTZ27_30895 [Streptomyces griseocarneus]|nr:hypothetical protein CTZ27_30895 [Streptomyces griseocarneus]
MSTPTTSYGFELSIGDDTSLDDTPVCCDEDMTGEDTSHGYRDYTCHGCGTVLTLAPSGLVFDISNR